MVGVDVGGSYIDYWKSGFRRTVPHSLKETL